MRSSSRTSTSAPKRRWSSTPIPGDGIIYILEGSLEDQIEGQPPKTFHAGDALAVPAGVIHAVRNAGRGNAAELATYLVEKGKPLLTLAEWALVPPVRPSVVVGQSKEVETYGQRS